MTPTEHDLMHLISEAVTWIEKAENWRDKAEKKLKEVIRQEKLGGKHPKFQEVEDDLGRMD